MESAGDASSKLALWKEELCCIVSNDSDGECSGEAAKGGADPQGANFVKVVGVFVLGKETIATEGGVTFFGSVAVEDKLNQGDEVVNAGADGIEVFHRQFS